jgi:hypothetical protein
VRRHPRLRAIDVSPFIRSPFQLACIPVRLQKELPVSFAALLRRELALRAKGFAVAGSVTHAESYGEAAVVCFPAGEAQHGNFLAASYRAILENVEWHRRLAKVHTSARRSLPRADHGRWRELDSCMSSDALLMNVFCYPRVLAATQVCRILGAEKNAAPQFGFPARVPLTNGHSDRTEVDLRLGSVLIEAKLTETDFQRAPKQRMDGYRDFEEVFECEWLPQAGDSFESYQILRNILAASASGVSFCLLVDARRPDLIEKFYVVLRCVRPVDLRLACRVVTWQELARVLPAKLRAFLAVKYGISGDAFTTETRSPEDDL